MAGRKAFLAAMLAVAFVAVGAQAASQTAVPSVDGHIGWTFGSSPSWINDFVSNDVRIEYSTDAWSDPPGADAYKRRALVNFDVNWAAVDATVTSATLRLVQYGTPSGTFPDPCVISVYRLTEAWDATASFFDRVSGTAWTDAGGTYTTDGAASFTVGTPIESDNVYTVDIASMAQYWLDHPTERFGVVLMQETGTIDGDMLRLYSVDYLPNETEETGMRSPRLMIESTPEPATMALLALGGLAVIRRKRK